MSEQRWDGCATVLGEAASQGSKRAFVVNGRAVMTEDNKKLKPWRSQMQAAMQEDAPPGGPLRGVPVMVVMTVFVARPRSHYGTGKNAGVLKKTAPRYPASGGDLDKQARACGDAGTAVWWADDRQIACWYIRRRYAEDGRARVLVSAEEMGEDAG